tara:strand:- start:4865 stop:5044 length:180 start_codon:yes stop_codon:yes gene_type:complete
MKNLYVIAIVDSHHAYTAIMLPLPHWCDHSLAHGLFDDIMDELLDRISWLLSESITKDD